MNNKNKESWLLTRPPGLLVFVAALLVRLVYFAWSQSSPFLYQLSTDEAFYVDYARAILAGDSYPYANFMDPLIAYLLVIPLHFSDNLHLVRLLFLFMDCTNAFLIYKVVNTLTLNRKAAIIAGLLYTFYGLTVIYSVFITKSTPIIFLLLLISVCFLQGLQQRKKSLFFLSGLLSALLVFLGASFLLLGMVYLFLLLLLPEWRRYVVVYACGFALLMLLYVACFYLAGVNKNILPSNGGAVFYISNHAKNPWGTHSVPDFIKEATPQGIYHAFKDEAFKDDAFKEGQGTISDKEVSRYWYKKALQENREYPDIALQRLLNKISLLMANSEISQNYYFPYIKEHSLKNIPLLTFAFVLGFGVSGLLFFSGFERKLLLVLAPVVVTITTCLLFFMSARMRLPLVPFLIIGCSYWALALQAPWKKVLAAFFLSLLLTGLSVGVADDADKTSSVRDQYNLAVVMLNAKMFDEADQLSSAVLQHEKTPASLFLKAVILSSQGRCQEALPYYAAVADMQPDYPELDYNRHICLQFLQKNP